MCCRKQTDCKDTNGGGTVRSQNRVIAIILVLRSRMSQRAPSGTTTPSAKQLAVFVEWSAKVLFFFLGECGFTADHHLPGNHLQIWCDDTFGWCKNCLIYSCNMQHILHTLTNTVNNQSQHFSWVRFPLRQWVRWIFQTESFCFSFPSVISVAFL